MFFCIAGVLHLHIVLFTACYCLGYWWLHLRQIPVESVQYLCNDTIIVGNHYHTRKHFPAVDAAAVGKFGSLLLLWSKLWLLENRVIHFTGTRGWQSTAAIILGGYCTSFVNSRKINCCTNRLLSKYKYSSSSKCTQSDTMEPQMSSILNK